MEEADGWKTYPIVAEASKADMECAIRCSQDNDCLSRGLPKGLYKEAATFHYTKSVILYNVDC